MLCMVHVGVVRFTWRLNINIVRLLQHCTSLNYFSVGGGSSMYDTSIFLVCPGGGA